MICVAQKQWAGHSQCCLSLTLSLTLLCGRDVSADWPQGEFGPGLALGEPIMAVGAAVPLERLLDSRVLGIYCVRGR